MTVLATIGVRDLGPAHKSQRIHLRLTSDEGEGLTAHAHVALAIRAQCHGGARPGRWPPGRDYYTTSRLAGQPASDWAPRLIRFSGARGGGKGVDFNRARALPGGRTLSALTSVLSPPLLCCAVRPRPGPALYCSCGGGPPRRDRKSLARSAASHPRARVRTCCLWSARMRTRAGRACHLWAALGTPDEAESAFHERAPTNTRGPASILSPSSILEKYLAARY